MTPREKAEELVEKFVNANFCFIGELEGKPYPTAKECALITVDEILDVLWDNGTSSNYYKYWQEVKNEIEKL